MQFFAEIVFLAQALLACADAKEQTQTWGQSSGLSRTTFMQDAATFLGIDDTDATSIAARFRGSVHVANIRSTQLLQRRGTADKVATQTATTATNSAAAVEAASAKAEAAKAKAETIRAVALARAESASSAKLKTELVNSVRTQYGLRRRLKEVSTEARSHLAILLKQLELARAAAQRSETVLRTQIKKEALKLNIAEKSQMQLRQQLSAASVSEKSTNSAAAAAGAQAAAKSEAEEKHMQNLTMTLKSTQKQAMQATSRLQQQLRLMQQTNAKAQSKLSEQLKQTEAAASKEKAQISSKLAEAVRSSEKASDELEAEKFSETLLKQNLTRIVESADSAALKARKERMGLLVQVSGLQEQSSVAQKKALAAMQQAKLAKKDAETRINQEFLAAKHQESERQLRISALLQETQAAHANLTAASGAATAARRQVEALQVAVSEKTEQLRVALLDSTDLRAARDAASKGEATFQKMDTIAEASLKQNRQELSSATSELQQVKSDLSSHLSDASSLSAKCKRLEAEMSTLKQKSAAQQASTQQQMHDTMLSAASKVHELEDQNENLSDKLQKETAAHAAASEESTKSKDTLMQETDAALRSSELADSLKNTLEQAQKDAEASKARASELARNVAQLQSERDHAKVVITERSQDEQNWQDKAETLQATQGSEKASAKKMVAENQKLQQQVHDLSGEEQRADELEEELSGLRQSMQRKDSEEAQMAKNLATLRSLKDGDSAEIETARKETDSWHQQVDDLTSNLKRTQTKLGKRTEQRNKALERAREARSQEDEYFEENSRLQQQDDSVNAKLSEVGAAANHSQEENTVLNQKIEDLKSVEFREKANSHAAWVQNQGELMQSRRDLKLSMGVNRNLQDELQRTQAVLSDKERQTLGLPVLKRGTQVKTLATAGNTESVARAPEVLQPAPVAVPLEERHEEGAAAVPLTPQVSHIKVWETTAETAKPKRLLSKSVPAIVKAEPVKVVPKATPVVAKVEPVKVVPKAIPVAAKAEPVKKVVVVPAPPQLKKAAPVEVLKKAVPKDTVVAKAEAVKKVVAVLAPPQPEKVAVIIVKAATPMAAAQVQTTHAPLLSGEPQIPADDAAATLASVTDPQPLAQHSALQKLAAFFASPLQR